MNFFIIRHLHAHNDLYLILTDQKNQLIHMLQPFFVITVNVIINQLVNE
jgi:hypothetical protein